MILPISVCLVVKNEAERLERSLRPFIGRVAEIIAYDNGSTDRTIEILKKMGVTVVQGPWLGFSETRRLVWSMARQAWVLWLDADEVFEAETIDVLGKYLGPSPVLSQEGNNTGRRPATPEEKNIPQGYRIRRRVIFEGQTICHGDWGNDWVLRVFRRDNYTMADRLVHESVEVPGRVVDLPGIVEHHSFRNWADLEARSFKYAELWATQAVLDKKKPSSPVLRAAWKFFKGYIIKLGFLDGALGYKIALHNAREVYHKYKRLGELGED